MPRKARTPSEREIKLEKEGYLTVKNIIKKAKQHFAAEQLSEEEEEALKRWIQRNINNTGAERGDGTKYFYRPETVYEFLRTEKTIKHFNIYNGRLGISKTNDQVFQEQKEELDTELSALHKRWKKLGLSESDGNLLLLDKSLNRNCYLSVEEMECLNQNGSNIKGLHFRTDLSEEELHTLQCMELGTLLDEQESQKIEELFYRKKQELMLTALFNERYEINEDLLRRDVSNYIRGGAYSTSFNAVDEDIQKELDAIPQSPVVRKSYLRLVEGDGSAYVNKEIKIRKLSFDELRNILDCSPNDLTALINRLHAKKKIDLKKLSFKGMCEILGCKPQELTSLVARFNAGDE